MHFLIWETLSFNLMYVAACYPVWTTISKTSSLFTALLQHYWPKPYQETALRRHWNRTRQGHISTHYCVYKPLKFQVRQWLFDSSLLSECAVQSGSPKPYQETTLHRHWNRTRQSHISTHYGVYESQKFLVRQWLFDCSFLSDDAVWSRSPI